MPAQRRTARSAGVNKAAHLGDERSRALNSDFFPGFALPTFDLLDQDVYCYVSEAVVGRPHLSKNGKFMPDIYWYISADKIRALRDTKTRSSWQTLSLKLKLKFLEVEGGVAFNDSLQRDLKSLRKELQQAYTIVPFQDLKPGAEGAIFSFEGEAARMLTPEALWIGTERGSSALLLVGAPRNMAGQSQLKEGFMSPSANPVGALKLIAEGQQGPGLAGMLSYAWRTVMQDVVSSGAHFARVEGLAVFAASFKADPPLANAQNQAVLDRIVLGSPIYVRQMG